MNLQLNAAKSLIGGLLVNIFQRISTLGCVEWARENVRLGQESSTIKVGKFDALLFPALEYIYDCLDNPYIPVIYCIKSSRFGWTTLVIIWVAKTIVEAPRNILIGFGARDYAHKFYKDQWLPFIQGIPALLAVINKGLSSTKIAWNHTPFSGGFLRFISTNVTANLQSLNVPIAILEEPDLHKLEAEGFGNLIDLLRDRQKLVPTPLTKLLVGGTSSAEGASLIFDLIKTSNNMVFKAECHNCESLVDMNYTFFQYFQWEFWEDGKEHIVWGKYNPYSAKWFCPFCEAEWTDAQKNQNILAGKRHGFIDHTGKFSKGWHPQNPEVTDIFGFQGSECLSPLNGVDNPLLKASSFVEMSKKILAAKYSLEKGDESRMSVVWNNMFGWAYKVQKSSLTSKDLENFYSSYQEGKVPSAAFIPYISIDVQLNRLAFTSVAAGPGNTFYAVDWFEIFGEVNSTHSPVWDEATSIIAKGVEHVSGVHLNYLGVAIDCQDGKTAEQVYAWVASMQRNGYPVYAVRGVNELKLSSDPIFTLPAQAVKSSATFKEQSLASYYGVIPYKMGTHACQSKVMFYLENVTKKELDGSARKTEVLYFPRFRREDFLDQMTSCMLVPSKVGKRGGYMWELVSGRRMEALACVKMCFWLATKDGVFNYTEADWADIERSLFD